MLVLEASWIYNKSLQVCWGWAILVVLFSVDAKHTIMVVLGVSWIHCILHTASTLQDWESILDCKLNRNLFRWKLAPIFPVFQSTSMCLRTNKNHVWTVTKLYLTNLLTRSKYLVPVWMIANFLACQCAATNFSSCFSQCWPIHH
jgi:hypothetical protein